MEAETAYRVLKIVEEHPEITQRELAQRLGVSVGKANYCLQSLIRRGLVTVRNFKNSGRKRQYVYRLTPAGIAERTQTAIAFLRLKSDEFDEIREEIERLNAKLAAAKAET